MVIQQNRTSGQILDDAAIQGLRGAVRGELIRPGEVAAPTRTDYD